MSEPKNLFDELRARRAKEAESGATWKARQGEWLSDLGDLFRDIRGWLTPGLDEGLVRITQSLVTLSEPHIGSYDAPTLRIEMGGKIVSLEPRGANVVGAAGASISFAGRLGRRCVA